MSRKSSSAKSMQSAGPNGTSHQTKPEIAFALLQQAKATGAFSGRRVGYDSTFGNDPAFLDAVGEAYLYFAAVRSNTRVWLERPEIGMPPYKGRGPKKGNTADRPRARIRNCQGFRPFLANREHG